MQYQRAILSVDDAHAMHLQGAGTAADAQALCANRSVLRGYCEQDTDIFACSCATGYTVVESLLTALGKKSTSSPK
jgi:7-keto-8-aminopelargonate synthetase-like enzyme